MKTIFLVLLLIISFCSTAVAETYSRILQWDASVDEPYMKKSGKYRVYWRNTATEWNLDDYMDVGLVHELEFIVTVKGEYEFYVTAIDDRGLESTESKHVTGVFLPRPGPIGSHIITPIKPKEEGS